MGKSGSGGRLSVVQGNFQSAKYYRYVKNIHSPAYCTTVAVYLKARGTLTSSRLLVKLLSECVITLTLTLLAAASTTALSIFVVIECVRRRCPLQLGFLD